MRTRDLLLSFSILTLAACKEDPEGSASGDDSAAQGDDSAADDSAADDSAADDSAQPEGPEVLAVSPVNGATGVLPDVPIVITFDRSMDTASVEAALVFDGLGNAVSTQWNDDGSVLTLVPKGGLPVEEAVEGGEGARVAWSIGAGATDAEGMALEGSPKAAFHVARRQTASLRLSDTLTGRVQSDGQTSTSKIWVGDNSENVAMEALFTFSTEGLDQPLLVESATLTLAVSGQQGSPWRNMGYFQASRVIFGALDGEAYDLGAQGEPVEMKVISQSASDTQVEVSSLLEGALDSRSASADRLQVRVAFTDGSDGDNASDYVAFDKAGSFLEVSILVE